LIAACDLHIPISRLPAHVIVTRGASRLRGRSGLYLQRGDRIVVAAPSTLVFSYGGNRYRIPHAHLRLECRRPLIAPRRHPYVLAVSLQSGRVRVYAGPHPRHALVVTPEMLAVAKHPRTTFVVTRNPAARGTRAWTLDKTIVAARFTHQQLRINSRITYTAISNSHGLRLDVWPFSISRAQRAPTSADGLVPFWADGRQCSVGCSPSGVRRGWPIQPFHRQHAIRAGLNELRPANFHIGIDIEARNSQPVYPIESGTVRVFGAGTPDEHVQVGQFQYWHVDHQVSDGQHAVAYRTRLGTVKYAFKHVHVSELGPSGQYLNPLRPGRSLSPYTDTEPPVIGTPRVYGDGRVTVGAFDPQSFVEKLSYETPVLAPAALAWRLFDKHGHPRTGLEWALRGSQNYPPSLKSTIFAPGAKNPGFTCFAFHRLCVPTWNYWLAGGLTGPLPLGSLPRGRYRLSVYAWDWTGRSSALDRWITIPIGRAPEAPTGPITANFDFQ
jgi:murein DD-endopeptidase MepM/ murein hydrolase activator NlpD